MCPVRNVTYVSGRSPMSQAAHLGQAAHSKYAAILTFPLSGTCQQKTVLPKICQKFE